MGENVRLTSFSHGAGCACKLAPGDLAEVLGRAGTVQHGAEVLVAADTSDDAAVYRLPDGTALVQSVDFFTPVVDDAFDWGRIAAANALSDLYAMGARPILALNVAAWPVEELPLDLLGEVLRGGEKVATEAGAAVVGGHTIHDPGPKYGMAVTGLAPVERITRNSTARPGADLLLTKPLGIGIATTAVKRGVAEPEQLAAAVDLMTTLNAPAAEAVAEVGAQAVTDVTGFGLLGHLHELVRASGVGAEIDATEVPLLEGTLRLAAEGVVPGGTRKNHRWVSSHVAWGDLDEAQQLVLADAQTSGGLLIASDPGRTDDLREALRRRGVAAATIGATGEGEPGRISLRGRLREARW